MSTQSLIRRIAGAVLIPVTLAACGGINFNSDTFKIKGFVSRSGPRSNEADKIPRIGFLRQVQLESRPGIHLDTRYGEIAISGQPDPMVVMVTVTTDI